MMGIDESFMYSTMGGAEWNNIIMFAGIGYFNLFFN